MKFKQLLALIALSVLAGCNWQGSSRPEMTVATDNVEVRAEINICTKLGGYHSYHWQASSVQVENPEQSWKPPAFDIDAELHRLINAQMQAKGYKKVAAAGDMVIAYSAGVSFDNLKLEAKQHTQLDILDNAPSAAMVVMLIDDCGQIIWAGRANGELSQNTTDDVVKQRMAYVIKEMFSYLPARK